MKIIQIAVTPSTIDSQQTVFALTDTGRIFYCPAQDDRSKPVQWFELPTELEGAGKGN